jgi:hypothetical protein
MDAIASEALTRSGAGSQCTVEENATTLSSGPIGLASVTASMQDCPSHCGELQAERDRRTEPRLRPCGQEDDTMSSAPWAMDPR